MQTRIVREKLKPEAVREIVISEFGDMAKVDVDIVRQILVIGGEWHSEGQDLLVKDGSSGEDVWGCNYYPFRGTDKRIEYNSLINLKPSLGARDMEIQESRIRQNMREVIESLLLTPYETIQR